MKSNGVVGALAIVVVGGLAAACTTEAVGDGKTGADPFGLASGVEGTKNDQASNGRTQTGQSPTNPTPGGTSTSPTAPTAPPSNGPKDSCYVSGNATCDACANAKCCDSINACLGNTQCSNLYDCLNSCWDAACESSCNQQFAGGVSLFQKASQCVRGTCGASCSG